jgi:hypothetical protein
MHRLESSMSPQFAERFQDRLLKQSTASFI